ncbi:MAG: hypothetical protein WBG69_06475 [Arcobacteraceae bacterium]
MGFLNTIFNKIKSATRERCVINKEQKQIQILLDSSDEEYFTLSFENMDVRSAHDANISKSYIVDVFNSELGKLYIEVIQLDLQHQWNSSAGGCFDFFIKQQFGSSNFEFIKSEDGAFYKFTKYCVAGRYEVGMIWLNLNKQDIFIFDVKGKLFNDLLQIYNITNKVLQINNDEILDINLKTTLTQTNIIDNFITKID